MRLLFIILFLALVSVFCLLSKVLYADKFEKDIATHIAGISEDPKFSDVRTSVDHLDVILEGTVAEDSHVADAAQWAKVSAPAGRVFKNRITGPSDLLNAAEDSQNAEQPGAAISEAAASASVADQTPTFRAELRGDTVKLTGTLPSEEIKQAFDKQLPNIERENKISVKDSVSVPVWKDSMPLFVGEFFLSTKNAVLNIDRESLVLEGEVASEEVKNKLVSRANEIETGGLTIVDRLKTPADKEPATLTVQRIGNTLHLSGLLPDEESKTSLVDRLQKEFSSLTIDDRLETNPAVAQPAWGSVATEAIPRLLRKSTGDSDVEYTSTGIYFSGTVRDEATRDELKKLIANANPDGVTITNDISIHAPSEVPLAANEVEILPNAGPEPNIPREALTDAEMETPQQQPAEEPAPVAEPADEPEAAQPQFTASFDHEGILLTGKLPTAALVEQMEASAQSSDRKRQVLNDLKVNKELANPGYLDDLPAFLIDFSKHATNGSMRIDSGTILIAGDVPNEVTKEMLGNRAEDMAGSALIVDNRLNIVEVAPSDPPVSDVPEKEDPDILSLAQMAADLKTVPVFFGTGKTTISPRQMPRVEKMASKIKGASENMSFTVAGFADPRGNAKANRKLSIKRANTVKAKLVELGITEDRLKTASFSSSEDSTSKNWELRRVELLIDTNDE